MFEHTLLPEAGDVRKPYSMALSLILQISVLAVLCATPFVFTQALPTMQLKSVLAAPPKPPAVLRRPTGTRVSTTTARMFRLNVLNVKRVATRQEEAVDEPPAIGVVETSSDPSGVDFGEAGSPLGTVPPEPPAVKPKAQPQPPRPLRVGTMSSASLIRMVHPQYPPLAKASRIQGIVEFTATISREGIIENLVLVRGHPLLVRSATEAVLQWRYHPTLLNGSPVEVITDILVNFTLNE